MNEEKIEWTIENMRNINKRLAAVGMPTFIIDEENKMVYKDLIHQLLGIGVKLES
jgi:protein-disulfide isomerase-like protein with CxxC motif